MCGIAGIFGKRWKRSQLEAMVASQRHRGPDAEAVYISPGGMAGLGHNRLSIIDLSAAGRQPMSDLTGRYWMVFNGEIYNYLELRRQLEPDCQFRTNTDTEVLLTAYQKWGEKCLDKLLGMFAFAIWDEREQKLFAARDRFGVKPLNYCHQPDGTLLIASEIKALHRAGVSADADPVTWSTYLTHGLYDHTARTFWKGISSLPPGHLLTWHNGQVRIECWYDLPERINDEFDERSSIEVEEEYRSLMAESIRLRFRADVPVGINLSGGLDSSVLLGMVHEVQGRGSDVKAFTFTTGSPEYDELPWVSQMLARTNHRMIECRLQVEAVPSLAESIQQCQDEPFGGLPTLAYAHLFESARREGVIVILDGQGMDEQWAGYDYYQLAQTEQVTATTVQGTKEKPVCAECLAPEFRHFAEPFTPNRPFPDALRNLQYRDIRYTKIPRALRFNDRVSMRSSVELREPFLDHRLVELAFSQPPERKILNGTRKFMLRQIAKRLLPDGVVEAPKRPLQTPQREWLRGPLRDWAEAQIENALAASGAEWLDEFAVRRSWKHYCKGEADNSFYIWQWISIGLLAEQKVAAVYE